MPNTHKWSIPEKLTLSSNLSKQNNYDQLSTKKEQNLMEVRSVLREVEKDSFEGLVLIDALQRLGIDYHFQEDIEVFLHREYMDLSSISCLDEHDLHEVSTRFRLLRQQGYNIPADVFSKFKDKNGQFKPELSADIRGLMGLYEASQLSMEGEDILDEAQDFSCQHLKGWMTHLDHHRARIVGNTLGHPHHKSLPRVTAKNFLHDYEGPHGWHKTLQELAKMDVDAIKSAHQKEVLQVSKWWKGTGLAMDLTFVRDQPLKWYMWSMAALPDPRFSDQRIDITKPISFVYVIDDIFDVYGTLEELILFTDAVNRWDIEAIAQLPGYMQICFKALYNMTNELANKIHKKHGWNPIDSLRRAWASLCDAFLVEAKWFASGKLPNAEEYLENGIISSGVHVVLVHMFFLLGHGISKETVNLMDDNPGIITSTATILRLWDDLGSAKDENQDGHDGSYIECYMKDHKGSSVEIARKQITRLISDAWKCLNRDCLSPNRFSATYRQACLNVARMVPLMYTYDNKQSLPMLEEYMKSVFL